MNRDSIIAEIRRLADEAAAHHPDGVKPEELVEELLPDVVALLVDEDRNVNAEAETLIMSVNRDTRRSRRQKLTRTLGDLAYAFADEDGEGAYCDPLLEVSFPIGTDDGMVKTLRNWSEDDMRASQRMAYRNAAEVTAAAKEHDEAIERAIESMRIRNVRRFGDE